MSPKSPEIFRSEISFPYLLKLRSKRVSKVIAKVVILWLNNKVDLTNMALLKSMRTVSVIIRNNDYWSSNGAPS